MKPYALKQLLPTVITPKSDQQSASVGRTATYLTDTTGEEYMTDDMTATLLQTLQRDQDPAVRHEAVLALGCAARSDPRLIPLLEDALDDPSGSVRHAVVHALGLSRRSEATLPLLRAMQARSELCAAVADALVTIGDTSARAVLVELLQTSETPRVRRGAARALRRLAFIGDYSRESLNCYEDDNGIVHVLA